MLSGRETKLFPLKFKCSKEDEWQISLGVDERSEPLRSKYLKECRPDKEGNTWPTGTESDGM